MWLSRTAPYLFLAMAILVYNMLKWQHDDAKQSWLENHMLDDERDFHIIQDNLNSIAKSYFNSVVNTPQVQELVSQAYQSPEQKNLARKALF